MFDVLLKKIFSKDTPEHPDNGAGQPRTAKIKTPGGWSTLGSIKVGDKITTPDGGVTVVVDLKNKGIQDLYRVMLTDGRSARVSLSHPWSVRNQHGDEFSVNTGELRALLNKSGAYSIPLPSPEMDSEQPDLDGPYDTAHTLSQLHQGISHNKPIAIMPGVHLPEHLLNVKTMDRYALLQGFLDGGRTQLAGNSIVMYTTSNTTAYHVQYLVRSIGGQARVEPTVRDWAVTIRHPTPYALLCNHPHRDQLEPICMEEVHVVWVEPAARGPVIGLITDDPSGQWISDEFVVMGHP